MQGKKGLLFLTVGFVAPSAVPFSKYRLLHKCACVTDPHTNIWPAGSLRLIFECRYRLSSHSLHRIAGTDLLSLLIHNNMIYIGIRYL